MRIKILNYFSRNSEKFCQIDTSGQGIEDEKKRKGSILLSYSAEDIANQVGRKGGEIVHFGPDLTPTFFAFLAVDLY